MQEEGEYTSPYDDVRTVAGTEVHYREMKGITLPPDGSIEPTAEEQAAFERGEINIAYGSSEREEIHSTAFAWIEDGISYSIYTYDPVFDRRRLLPDGAGGHRSLTRPMTTG